MQGRKLLLILLLLIAIPPIVYSLFNSLFHKTTAKEIVLSGNVEITEINIGFKTPGRVKERFVDEGYRVKRGDRLAKLEDEELKSLVLFNRAQVMEAKTRYRDIKSGARMQEIEQAVSNIRAIEAILSKAKSDYERADKLYREQLLSMSQFEAAKSAFEDIGARKRAAEEALSLLKAGFRQGEIEAAGLKVKQAQAQLDAYETRLADTLLVSPIDGVILKKNVEPGETVASGIPIFTIGDLENPWIRVYIKETELGAIKLGQRALITTDTYPGKTYEGVISYISSEAEFTPKNIQTKEERVKLVFAIKIRVANKEEELKPGMPADVKLLIP